MCSIIVVPVRIQLLFPQTCHLNDNLLDPTLTDTLRVWDCTFVQIEISITNFVTDSMYKRSIRSPSPQWISKSLYVIAWPTWQSFDLELLMDFRDHKTLRSLRFWGSETSPMETIVPPWMSYWNIQKWASSFVLRVFDSLMINQKFVKDSSAGGTLRRLP